MPSPMENKRRRLSEDSITSPSRHSTAAPAGASPTRKPSLMRNYMTPTKASIAKSYPHLAKPLSAARQQPSPTRQPGPASPRKHPPRPSIPPEPLTEVIGARSFLDIANAPEDNDVLPGEKDDTVREAMAMAMAMSVGATAPAVREKEKRKSLVESHLSSEEEIERLRGALMKRIRLLRAECENLEGRLEQTRQTRQTAIDTQEKAVQTNLPATMYLTILFGSPELIAQSITSTIE